MTTLLQLQHPPAGFNWACDRFIDTPTGLPVSHTVTWPQSTCWRWAWETAVMHRCSHEAAVSRISILQSTFIY